MYQRNESQIDNKRWQACPKCKHSTNDPGSIICEECGYSFLPSKTDKQKVRNLEVVKKDSAKKVKRTVRPKIYLFVAGGITALASSVLIVSNLNATSPEAKLGKAEEIIYFGGEPCGRALITEEVAQAIQKINPELKFAYYRGSGEDQIDDLIEGDIDFALSEKAYLAQHYQRGKKRGVELYGIAYGIDGVTFFTHPENKVRPLTVDEIKAIVEGRITDWRQFSTKEDGTPMIIPLEKLKKGEEQTIIPVLIGGNEAKANPMGFYPSKTSPNTRYFRERNVAKEFTKKTEYAFFYTSATLAVDELDEISVISILKKNGDIVSPVMSKGLTNKEDIGSGYYPLRRQVMIIFNKKILNPDRSDPRYSHNSVVKAFVDFIVSKKGQSIVDEADFVAKQFREKEKDSKLSFLPWF